MHTVLTAFLYSLFSLLFMFIIRVIAMLGDIINIGWPNPDQQKDLTILVGDVGGTKTNLALFRIKEGNFDLIEEAKFNSREHKSFLDVVNLFLEGKSKPDRVSVGIAGPVVRGYAYLTNLGWAIDEKEIMENTGIQHVYLINDLKANAYGLGGLESKDILTIHEGDPELKGNAVIISPGTGLGEGAMYFDGSKYHPFATEGGHADYAPETEDDIKILRCLQKKYGHVSWERIVSGMGILEVYACLSDTTVENAVQEVTQKFGEKDAAAAVSRGARNKDPLCIRTMDLFLRNLANEAANLVMKLMGTGGVFIGGGIVPKNLDMMQKQEFVNYFLEAGRLSTLLKHVPINIILNEKTALIGAALYGYYND